MEVQTPKELRPFTLYFKETPPNEKIVIKMDKWDVHYTIEFGFQKKKLNIHRTTEIRGSKQKKYKHLVTIRHFTLGRVLVYLKYNFPHLLQRYFFSKKINQGKLNRHNCILMPLECNQDKFANWMVVEKKKFRFSKKLKLPNPEDIYVIPDEINDCHSKSFIVYKVYRGNLRMQGFIYKQTNKSNSKSFFFISKRNLNHFMRDYAVLLYGIFQQINFKGKPKILTEMENRFRENYPVRTSIE